MSVSDKTFNSVLTTVAKELVNEDVEYANSIDTSQTYVSERTLRRVRKRIKNYDTTLVRARIMPLKRVVAAVLVVCVLSLGLCMSVDAVREKIVNTIIEWYDKFVSIFYESDETLPEIIEEYKEPTLPWVDVEKTVLVKEEKLYYVMYTNNSELILSYKQMPITELANKYNNEECIINELMINGEKAKYIIYENGSQVLIWADNKCRFAITLYVSNISIEDLVCLAESVK